MSPYEIDSNCGYIGRGEIIILQDNFEKIQRSESEGLICLLDWTLKEAAYANNRYFLLI